MTAPDIVPDPGDQVLISLPGLQALIDLLAARGWRVLGPTPRDGAVVLDDIAAIADLPQGWTDRQAPGAYRLEQRQDAALFGQAVGPHSWKRFLHPPEETLWRARRQDDGFSIEKPAEDTPRFAFVGVRACDVRAIAVQDKVLLHGPYVDASYAARRRDAIIITVDCAAPAGTCFCASMASGPAAAGGFDLALTELLDQRGHRFLVRIGSDSGAALLASLPHEVADADDQAAARAQHDGAVAQMGRALDTHGLQQRLQANPDHPHWDDVAARCLSCGNCTMVCPTCFCTDVVDHSDLAGQTAERVRRWDSCFSLDFSYIHGGAVRDAGRSRYRQWMTHKLAGWIDQFGEIGCVGCGRCITWCPAGIDITAEAAAIGAPVRQGGES